MPAGTALAPPIMNVSSDPLTPAIRLGTKIRALRQRLNYTLDRLAACAHLSKPFLSQVERGLAGVSAASLNSIAGALGVEVSYLLDAPEEQHQIHRREQLSFQPLPDSATRFAALTRGSPHQELEARLLRLPPGQPGPGDTPGRAGEEFLHVLSGELSLALASGTVLLRAGDSAHYKSAWSRGWTNPHRQEAVVLWVGTPRLP